MRCTERVIWTVLLAVALLVLLYAVWGLVGSMSRF
jgi:hypothetical protein